MEEKQIIACQDCRHKLERTNSIHFNYCGVSHKSEEKINYVTGEKWVETSKIPCSVFRELNYPTTCGPNARFFEPLTEMQLETKAKLDEEKAKEKLKIDRIARDFCLLEYCFKSYKTKIKNIIKLIKEKF